MGLYIDLACHKIKCNWNANIRNSCEQAQGSKDERFLQHFGLFNFCQLGVNSKEKEEKNQDADEEIIYCKQYMGERVLIEKGLQEINGKTDSEK